MTTRSSTTQPPRTISFAGKEYRVIARGWLAREVLDSARGSSASTHWRVYRCVMPVGCDWPSAVRVAKDADGREHRFDSYEDCVAAVTEGLK